MCRAPLVLLLAALAVAAVAPPAGAAAPGTNGRLVFERPAPDGPDLYTVGADGSGLTRLTRLAGVEHDPSWSPDGSKVAFTRAMNPEQGPYEIWTVNADGTGLTRVTAHRGFTFGPAWSPDGSRIVYSKERNDRPPALYVVNVDGSGARRLASSPTHGYTDPSWSPDGATIACAVTQVGETPREFDVSIGAVDADGGGDLRHLTRPGGPDEL